MSEPRRKIPAVDALLRSAAGQRASRRVGRPLFKACVKDVLDELRDDVSSGAKPPAESALVKEAAARADRIGAGLTTTINATGVVLHTGLGRAPLPSTATQAALAAAAGYSDLEIDLGSGKRGKRTTQVERLITALTGAEAAFVVNNNAGALMLALAALAKRRGVLVSRGELIEIGGEFRLPDIMSASGAKLVEVGTTNRTRIGDYRAAISDKTGLILKVHPSNYRVVGFQETPTVSQLSALARKSGVPLLHDIGSGLLSPISGSDEPSVAESLAAGADLLCFSGDKLLGGPQAGILVGSSDLIERLRRNPMSRALRVDKMQ
ncbi:MAG: L-seryl-tRNA(Sec) selenium transferase, partial [Actinobacteria bacterium]|nr:L-seryl-tRNA(Sec) selenium transferase [Actinomycetota bacterium]